MGLTFKKERDEKHDQLLSDVDTFKQFLDACWTTDGAYDWLFLPNDQLKGQVPIVMIAKGELEEVNRHLELLLDGAFS